MVRWQLIRFQSPVRCDPDDVSREVQVNASLPSQVRQALVPEFPELRGVSTENLMYVKEDLIIPHVSARVAMTG